MTAVDATYGPTYQPGDRLSAASLTQWRQSVLTALARHLRGLHQLFGVAEGLRPKLDKSGAHIEVSPGTAYDSYGVPLHLPRRHRLDLPRDGRDYLLVLRGQEPRSDGLHRPELAPQSCSLYFVPLGKRHELEVPLRGWEVPLGRLKRHPAGQAQAGVELDESCRANVARGFRQPFVATGVVPSGTPAIGSDDGTSWQVWVDTRSAGFLPSPPDVPPPADKAPKDLRPPVYLLSVGKPEPEDATRFLTGATALNDDPASVFREQPPRPLPLALVSEPTHEGFMLGVRYSGPSDDLKTLAATPLEVRWVGVEQPVGRYHERCADPSQESDNNMMKQANSNPKFRWPRFQDSQPLSADDLNAVPETARQLLWLHNRTLHDWGVAEGCSVSPQQGLRGIRVEPGYALNSDGHELIVADAVLLPVPARVVNPGEPSAKDWWVTVSYRPTAVPRNQDPSCRAEGEPVRKMPQTLVGWRDPQATDQDERMIPGKDVILATVTVEQGQVKTITKQGRRSAVPPATPHLFAGRQTLQPGDWQLWPSDDAPVGYKADINTAKALFVGTPQYFVTVEQSPSAEQADTASLTAPPTVIASSSTGFSVVVPMTVTPASSSAGAFVGFLVSLLLLFLVVLGRAWLVDPQHWPWTVSAAWLADQQHWFQAVNAAAIAFLTAVGLRWPTTAEGTRAKFGQTGSWLRSLVAFPSMFVRFFSRPFGLYNPLVGPSREWGLPAPDESRPRTLASGIGSALLLAAAIFGASKGLQALGLGSDGIRKTMDRIPLSGDPSPKSASPATVLSVWGTLVAALAYGSTRWAGKSVQMPWFRWLYSLAWLLRTVPDRLIHLLPDLTAKPGSQVIPPAKPAPTGNETTGPDQPSDASQTPGGSAVGAVVSKDQPPTGLTIAWMGIEV